MPCAAGSSYLSSSLQTAPSNHAELFCLSWKSVASLVIHRNNKHTLTSRGTRDPPPVKRERPRPPKKARRDPDDKKDPDWTPGPQ